MPTLPGNRGSRALFADPDEHQAITELLAAGTLVEWEDTLAISVDAAFSLYERYRPSSILTAMSQSVDAHRLDRALGRLAGELDEAALLAA